MKRKQISHYEGIQSLFVYFEYSGGFIDLVCCRNSLVWSFESKLPVETLDSGIRDPRESRMRYPAGIIPDTEIGTAFVGYDSLRIAGYESWATIRGADSRLERLSGGLPLAIENSAVTQSGTPRLFGTNFKDAAAPLQNLELPCSTFFTKQ